MGFYLEQKKEEKRQGLLDAAYALFLEKGTVKTTINDIVERARVAKGTFYLYFRDKETVLQALVYKISYRILSESYAAMERRRTDDFAENVILLVDYIIEYFKKDKEVLRILERNFSWPLLENEIARGDDPLVVRLRADLCASAIWKNRTEDEIFKLIFIIVEMCGSICYAAMIENRPDTIDNMKPVLYDIIRKSLR